MFSIYMKVKLCCRCIIEAVLKISFFFKVVYYSIWIFSNPGGSYRSSPKAYTKTRNEFDSLHPSFV